MTTRRNPQMEATRALKQQRLKQSSRNTSSVPSSISVTVVGSGSDGNPRSLYISTDHQKYLINCGEGTQRLAHEHGLKLSKLSDVFITQNTWENFGGLPGLLMSLQGIGVPQVNIHGPDGIETLHSITQSFSITPEISVKYPWNSLAPDEEEYSDSTMKVKRIPLCTAGEEHRKSKKLKTSKQKDVVYCYVCQFHDKPGRLLVEKCLALGVPKGALLGRLKNGEDITLENGNVVLNSEVCEPPIKGPVIIVVDCPSSEYLEPLTQSDFLRQEFKNEAVKLVVHFSPADIVKDVQYVEFCSSFSSNVFHLGLNANTPQASFLGASELQARLNLIDAEIFPSLKIVNEMEIVPNALICPGSTSLSYVLRPEKELGVRVPNLENKLCKEDILSINGLKSAIDEYHNQCESLKGKTEKYPTVAFLGTGSAIPSKQRNTSCILLKVDDETSYLFDCGEGSCGQLMRLFGEDFTSELSKIKMIFISHLHADHHLGLITVLLKRSKETQDPLFLIAPSKVLHWLGMYNDKYEKLNHSFRPVTPRNVCGSQNNSLSYSELKLEYAKCVDVRHCRESFGIVVIVRTGSVFKIVYSGDAMPTLGLVQHGMDCDLLIHEATMEDEMKEDAEAKKHSTLSQAIDVGVQMRAKFILLTHFSQRYAKLPLIKENFPKNVGIAFDNMLVNLNTIQKLSFVIHPLKSLFAQEYEEMMQRTELRLFRKANEEL